MVEIAIETLRELHRLSDTLRGLFYDMECSEGGETKYHMKTPGELHDYRLAAQTALKMNQIILDVDAENNKKK